MNRHNAGQYCKEQLKKYNLSDWSVRITPDPNKPFLGLCDHRHKTILLNGYHIDMHGHVEHSLNHRISHCHLNREHTLALEITSISAQTVLRTRHSMITSSRRERKRMTLHQLISRLSLFEMNRNVVFELDKPDNSKYDIKIDHMKVKDDDVIITLRQCITKDK